MANDEFKLLTVTVTIDQPSGGRRCRSTLVPADSRRLVRRSVAKVEDDDFGPDDSARPATVMWHVGEVLGHGNVEKTSIDVATS